MTDNTATEPTNMPIGGGLPVEPVAVPALSLANLAVLALALLAFGAWAQRRYGTIR